jgi:hypothetical protein
MKKIILFILLSYNIYSKPVINIVESYKCFDTDWNMKTLNIISVGDKMGFNIDSIYLLTDVKTFTKLWNHKIIDIEAVIFYTDYANYFDGITIQYVKHYKDRLTEIIIKTDCEHAEIKDIVLTLNIRILKKWEYLR